MSYRGAWWRNDESRLDAIVFGPRTPSGALLFGLIFVFLAVVDWHLSRFGWFGFEIAVAAVWLERFIALSNDEVM